MLGLPLALLLSLSVWTGLAFQAGAEKPPQEEREDYFQKWLKETVVYIIAPEERAVFERLTTGDEKENFIEQFWQRRDPDPRTPNNEFKEEHYRRLAYTNDRFTAGWPGWQTDRGRVYIIHGEPDEIEDKPSGGHYERTLREGGGRTSVYPFQKWRYRYIEGMGNNIEIEFVDRDFSGIYRLALTPDEKDAFLHVPNAGFTLAEELGLATRRQRPYFAPHASYPLMNYHERDSVFARYERFVNIQRPQKLKNPELKELVETRISFNQIPFQTRVDAFRLSPEQALVPVTLELHNRDLTFALEGDAHRAKVVVYGLIRDLSNRFVDDFEDEMTATFSAADLESGLLKNSAYNRLLLLGAGKRYKLELVIKDLNSGNVGTQTTAIRAPAATEELTPSPLVLASYIAPVTDSQLEDQMFVLGDVLVRPSLSKSFSANDYFAVYLQLYNVAVDESSQQPYFRIRYRILLGNETVAEESDEVGESIQYHSPQRTVLIKRLPLNQLPAGRYRVEVAFTDRIRDETVTAQENFEIKGP